MGSLGLPWLIQKYFYSGYTVFNTLIYGLILILILYGIIKLFEKIDIDPKSIIFSLIPFIFLGSSIRALVDNNVLPYNVFLITPGLYFLVGFLAISTLLFSVFLYKKANISYKRTIFSLGLVFSIFPLVQIHYFNLNIAIEVLVLWFIITMVFIAIGRFWSLFKSKINLAIISAHIFDGTTTFIGVDFYGYHEQHVLPAFIYNLTHSAVTIYPLKIAVIILSLYLIDRYIDDEKLNGLLKLTIFVLGLAPGLRNFLTMCI